MNEPKPVVAFDFPGTSGLEIYSKFLNGKLEKPIHENYAYKETENGYLCYIEPVDHWRIAYTWEPKPVTFANNITPYDYFIGKSHYGAPSLFKPSIGEVLENMPEHLKVESIAFEIDPHDKSVWNCSIDGYHTFLVRVFKDRSKINEET
ncbi:MAG: hypothetical protein V3U54_13350 [Thermodesulfobacteriota bacterium]